MAAGEDQAQTIVRDFTVVVIWFVDYLAREELRVRLYLFFEASLSPQSIDCFVLGSLNNPGAGRFGHALASPLVNGCGKRFLSGIFRQLEVAELPDQSGDNPAPVGPIDSIDSNIGVRRHI